MRRDQIADQPLRALVHFGHKVVLRKFKTDPRGHADHVSLEPLLSFLRTIAGSTPAVDVMIEAKRKDEALFKLMDELRAAAEDGAADIRIVDGASIEIEA